MILITTNKQTMSICNKVLIKTDGGGSGALSGLTYFILGGYIIVLEEGEISP